jgi:hypothetical protein
MWNLEKQIISEDFETTIMSLTNNKGQAVILSIKKEHSYSPQYFNPDWLSPSRSASVASLCQVHL